MSLSIWRGAFGRCTLTATSRPFGSTARCTWPIDAAASGRSSNSRKSRAIGWCEILEDHPLDVGERKRADVVLEAAELGDDVRRDDVGARREQLPELDEGRPELVEHLPQMTPADGRGRRRRRTATLQHEPEAVTDGDLRDLAEPPDARSLGAGRGHGPKCCTLLGPRRQRGKAAGTPPSTGITAPVVARERSETRNATASRDVSAGDGAPEEAAGGVERLDLVDGDPVRLGALAAEVVRPELRAREDRVGVDGVRADAVGAALERRDPHQLDEPGLRHRVGAETGAGREGVLRGHVDEAAADPLLPHEGDDAASEKEVRRQVHLEAAPPFRLIQGLERPGGSDARVQDDRVEAAEGRDRRVHRAVDDVVVGEVARHGDGAVKALAGGCEALLVEVGEHQVRPTGGEIAGDIPADARGGAGDEDNVADELRRRRCERQLVQLERPFEEVADLLLVEPARIAEAVERRRDRGVGVSGDLQAHPGRSRVRAGADAAEAGHEDDPARLRDVGRVSFEPDDAATGTDAEHVVGRAAPRGDPRDVGAVRESPLAAAGGEHHAPVAGQPPAQRDEEPLDHAAVGLQRLRLVARHAEVGPMPARRARA